MRKEIQSQSAVPAVAEKQIGYSRSPSAAPEEIAEAAPTAETRDKAEEAALSPLSESARLTVCAEPRTEFCDEFLRGDALREFVLPLACATAR